MSKHVNLGDQYKRSLLRLHVLLISCMMSRKGPAWQSNGRFGSFAVVIESDF